MTPAERAKLDQSRAAIVEMWCPLLGAMYRGWQVNGFSEERAFELCIEYMTAILERPRDPFIPPYQEPEE